MKSKTTKTSDKPLATDTSPGHEASSTDIVLLPVASLKPNPLFTLVPPLSDDDFEALRDDIAARGVQVPIIVNAEGVILDGHHRHCAASELGLESIPAIVRRGLDPDAEIALMVALNLQRRQVSPSQRAAIVTKPEVRRAFGFADDAAERQRQGARRGGKMAGKGRQNDSPVATLPQGYPRAPSTRDRLAAMAGVSARTVDAAVTGWDEAPERMEAIATGRSKETVAAVARGVQGRRPERAGDDDGDAKVLAMPKSSLQSGEYDAELLQVAPMGKGSVALVWNLIAPDGADILVQALPLGRDAHGRVARASRVGRVLAKLVPWPDGPDFDLEPAIEGKFKLRLRVEDGRVEVDDIMTRKGGAIEPVEVPEEEVVECEPPNPPVTPQPMATPTSEEDPLAWTRPQTVPPTTIPSVQGGDEVSATGPGEAVGASVLAATPAGKDNGELQAKRKGPVWPV